MLHSIVQSWDQKIWGICCIFYHLLQYHMILSYAPWQYLSEMNLVAFAYLECLNGMPASIIFWNAALWD